MWNALAMPKVWISLLIALIFVLAVQVIFVVAYEDSAKNIFTLSSNGLLNSSWWIAVDSPLTLSCFERTIRPNNFVKYFTPKAFTFQIKTFVLFTPLIVEKRDFTTERARA